jgi:hypothetical protein
MSEMEPNDYQLVRIGLLAAISDRAAELGQEIFDEAMDENAALREQVRHAENETAIADACMEEMEAANKEMFSVCMEKNREITALRAQVAGLTAALTSSDSMLSLIRHRCQNAIRWGAPGLPTSQEVDEVIGKSRRALPAIPAPTPAREADAQIDVCERELEKACMALIHIREAHRYEGFDDTCVWCGGGYRSHHLDCPLVIANRYLNESDEAPTPAREAELPSDDVMTERIRALRFAIPFTIADEGQIARLLTAVRARYTETYGVAPDEEQVQRVCGLYIFSRTAAPTPAREAEETRTRFVMDSDTETAYAITRAQEIEIEIARAWLAGVVYPVAISDDDLMRLCRTVRRLAQTRTTAPATEEE